jgi:NADH:ubiquinone oxidoreductase subunit E
MCESFKDLISKLGKHSNNAIKYEMKLKNTFCTKNCVKNIPYMEDKVNAING